MATKNKTTKKTNTKSVSKTEETSVTFEKATETIEKDFKEKTVIMKKPELDINTIVTVKNGYQGKLIYKSKKTGERFIWEEFGDEQDIELGELKSAKNSSKTFFENNWFLIDDPDVIDYLGVNRYYNNALTFEEFEELFTKSPDEIENIVSKLSKGQKHSVAYRARKLIQDEEIDSNKVISTLEKCLSVKLQDR